ncbi:MAG: Rpn family recombination-promoting nuclease/putative transposase [Lachnospiraceae bacterium]|nr:Rpn family recombination-promoting nuclease/putative transposase [Lachnospiraceae bacterium]
MGRVKFMPLFLLAFREGELMGKTDISQMKFMRDARHFADFWNGLVFDGKQVINHEDLTEINPVGLAVTKGRKSKKTADMVMGKMKNGEVFSILISENQLEMDYGMIIRVHLREMMEYDKQMERIAKKNKRAIKEQSNQSENSGEFLYGMRKQDRLKPVSTLVLYWNKNPWDGAKSLHELLDFSEAEEMRNLISDVRMNLVDIDQIDDEQNLFNDYEVRDLVALFKRRNDKQSFKKYVDDHGDNVHEDTIDVLSSLVSSPKLKKLIEDSKKGKGDVGNMCLAIDQLIEDGEKKGSTEATTVINNLNAQLISEKRYDDLERSTKDKAYQYKLVKKYFPEKAKLFA